MPRVIADITMSLDGFVTGPLAESGHGLGDVDELHQATAHTPATPARWFRHRYG
jgi:hypothetical protein